MLDVLSINLMNVWCSPGDSELECSPWEWERKVRTLAESQELFTVNMLISVTSPLSIIMELAEKVIVIEAVGRIYYYFLRQLHNL